MAKQETTKTAQHQHEPFYATVTAVMELVADAEKRFNASKWPYPEQYVSPLHVAGLAVLWLGFERVAEALTSFRRRTIAGMDATPDEFRAIIHALHDRLEQTETELEAMLQAQEKHKERTEQRDRTE